MKYQLFRLIFEKGVPEKMIDDENSYGTAAAI